MHGHDQRPAKRKADELPAASPSPVVRVFFGSCVMCNPWRLLS